MISCPAGPRRGEIGEHIHDLSFLFVRPGRVGRRGHHRRTASAHPHVWVTVKSELVYAPDGSVTGVRHAWTFDDMFSVFAIQGLESQEEGRVHPRGARAARRGQRHVAQGIRLLHLRQGERQEGRVRRSAGRLLSRLRHQGDGADAVLHAAAQGAGEGEGSVARSLRSRILRRLQLRREGSGQARRRPRAMQALGRAPAGNERRAVAATEPARSRTSEIPR